MKRLLLAPIRLYRRHLSALKGSPTCRFTPTCSAYAYHAISEWGAIAGLLLGAFRLLRCQPLCKGGHDPVPRRKRKLVPKTEIFGKSAKYFYEIKDYPYLSFYERYVE